MSACSNCDTKPKLFPELLIKFYQFKISVFFHITQFYVRTHKIYALKDILEEFKNLLL